MAIKLFRDLNHEWSLTVRSRSVGSALQRWGESEPALARFGDVDSIIETAHAPDRVRADDALAALLRIGKDEQLAWRVVLHSVMPGLVRMTGRFLPGPWDPEEVAATVVSVAWSRIAEYPLDRRPRSIAANIVLDTRQVSSGRLFRNSGVEIPSSDLTEYRPAPPVVEEASVKLVRLLDRAVKRDIVSIEDARLVALTRIQDVPVEDLAAERGILPHSLRRRRLRVEAVLSAAVA